MIKGTFEDFIGIWDNSVDENICKELIKYYDWSVKNDYNFVSDSAITEEENLSNRPGRQDTAVFIGSVSKQYPIGLCTQYWKCLEQCIGEYLKNYAIQLNGSLHSWIFKVHKVKEKQGYHVWHYENDSYDSRDRFLAFMTYLQAPTEGGETEFLHQSKRIDPVVGKTLIWPPGFTHKHRGNPPLKGEKIYLTGWMSMYPTE